MKAPIFFFASVALWLCLGINGQEQQSAFKFRLTYDGLDYAGKEAVKTLALKIPETKIPDITDGDIEASNIKITQFTTPTSQVTLQAPSTFIWALGNAGVEVTAHVRACKTIWKKICASIDVKMRASGVNMQLTTTLGRPPTDPSRPTFLTANCGTSIGKLDVETEGAGALGWIINQFSGIIGTQVRPDVEKALSREVEKLILENANAELAKIPMNRDIDHRYNLDYGLATDPVITSAYLEVNMKALVTCLAAPTLVSPYPFLPLAPQILDKLRMIYVLISDKIANDLLYFAHKMNETSYLITKDEPKIGPFLNLTCTDAETCVGTWVDNAAELFPNVPAAELYVTTTTPPVVTCSVDEPAAFKANITLDLYAPMPTGNAPILLLTLAMEGGLNTSITNVGLVAHLNISGLSMEVIESHMPPYVEKMLQQHLMTSLKPLIEDKVNAIFGRGMPIPTVGDAVFSTPLIRLLDRTVQLESDVIYTPH